MTVFLQKNVKIYNIGASKQAFKLHFFLFKCKILLFTFELDIITSYNVMQQICRFETFKKFFFLNSGGGEIANP